ncbi:MAG: T9SS C-terminal target domain-containing protein [ANME-2 cluster archaeon]|nr:MAG: T9SS C-terminal target domain-containing protein [ANME-2 cluster archaeon]
MKKNIRRFSVLVAFKSIIIILFGMVFVGSASICLAQGSPWTTKTDMPTARWALSSSAVNGKIYVIGGAPDGGYWDDPSLAVVEVYNPLTDNWETKKPMPIGRNSFSSSVVNDIIYVFGGQSHAGTTNLSSVLAYDPLTDKWEPKTPMPDERSGLSSCVVKGKIYIIGGWNFYPDSNEIYHIPDVWEYDPATDTWDTTRASMEIPREYLTANVVDEKIYVFGGWDETIAYKTVEMYDPAIDKWKTMNDLPEERVYLKSCAVNNLIYIFGGTTLYSIPPKTDTWEYNPVTDSYKAVASMPMGLMHGSASELNGKIYTIGGISTAISWPAQALARVFVYNPHNDLLRFVETVNVDRRYAIPGSDNVLITTKMSDPNGITLFAKFVADQAFVDSVQLFDDGNHNDGSSGDSLFANSWPVPNEEKHYNVNLNIKRVTTDTVFQELQNIGLFTTIGPISYLGYELFTPNDQDINPGEIHRFKFILENKGNNALAEKVTAKITALDTFATVVSPSIQLSFSDISAGQSVISSLKPIKFSSYFSGPIDTVRFAVEIASNGIVFWQDSTIQVVVGVHGEENNIPLVYALKQNYPNPFNPSTTIGFTLPKSEFVELKVFNILGEKVATLVSNKLNQGNHTYTFDGKNIASGVYYYQLVAGDYREVKKMILLR